MLTRTMVASTTAPTATSTATASRVIAARNPKNAQPEARKSASDEVARPRQPARGSASWQRRRPRTPHSSTMDSARNARVRSRWRSHPSTVNAPSRMQAPPKAHDSTRVAVLKAPCSIRPNPRIAPTSRFVKSSEAQMLLGAPLGGPISARFRSMTTPSPRSPRRRPGRCRQRWDRRARASCRR